MISSFTGGEMSIAATYLCYLNIITYKFSNIRLFMYLFNTLIEEYGTKLTDEFAYAFNRLMFDDHLFPVEDGFHPPTDLTLSEVTLSQIELMRLFMKNNIHLKNHV